MIVEPATLPGVHVLRAELLVDDRGWFTRTHDDEVLAAAGLETRFPQHSTSHNRLAGTTRGLHLQLAPHEEAKVVRCVRGAVWDVVVDLRVGSATFGRWEGFRLDADEAQAVYIPAGCAHGFQTLVDDSDVAYQISVPYHPELQAGLRWDDPAVGIAWPAAPTVQSERDRSLPLLAEVEAVLRGASGPGAGAR